MPAVTRIGIDIGGTFTDFVIYRPASGKITTYKVHSTPQNPAEAVFTGLMEGGHLAGETPLQIIHGSTVATNALLERKGARTALVTTQGFRDVLQIGRQNRPSLYDLQFVPPPALIPESLRLEVVERVDSHGEVLIPLGIDQVNHLLQELEVLQPESIAVCLLFSFLYPQHERLIAERLRQAGYLVSVSSEILPEFREYERASTTAVNAYVSPVLDRYLSSLEEGLKSPKTGGERRLRVMQSNGGVISPTEARRQAVRCILSGPAGGIVGARYLAGLSISTEASDRGVRIITFDMGGTSTDVSLIDGIPKVTTESTIGSCPIRIPVLDIHTIGAGGGSIAHIDPGGVLRVGPESAGAIPGPACYGRGMSPTVTDANLLLGRLDANYFLGGSMPLDADRARLSIQRLTEALQMEIEQIALGVIDIANAHMERALRLISVERGYDPVDFALFAFGGAGGLHAAELARRLGIQRVLVPSMASTLSAFGMLVADVIRDYTQTVMLPGDTSLEMLDPIFQPMIDRGLEDVLAEGIPPSRTFIEKMMDVRYLGQSYELNIAFDPEFIANFHSAHHRSYGYNRPDTPVEIVNLRVRVTGLETPPEIGARPLTTPDPGQAFWGERQVTLHSGVHQLPAFRGEALQPGNRLYGPALVLRSATTILLNPGDIGETDSFNNLIIDIDYTQ